LHAVQHADVLSGEGDLVVSNDCDKWYFRATEVLATAHYRGKYGTKGFVVRAVIAAVKERGGRFLKIVGDGHSGVTDNAVIEKKVQVRLNKLSKRLKNAGAAVDPVTTWSDSNMHFCIEKLRAEGLMGDDMSTNGADQQEGSPEQSTLDPKPAAKRSNVVSPTDEQHSRSVGRPTNDQQHDQNHDQKTTPEEATVAAVSRAQKDTSITGPTVQSQNREETLVLGSRESRCNSTTTSLSDRDWSLYSVSPTQAPSGVWTFFSWVLLVQLVLIDDEILIKIWCWIFESAPYFKSTAIVHSKGGGRMGGLIWALASNLAEHEYVIRVIQSYSGTRSAKTPNPLQATSNHQDGHGQYGKTVFRVDGGFAAALPNGSVLHEFDCSTTPRLFHGTHKALCGEAKDGTNNNVHHYGVKRDGRPSTVVQIIRRDKGPVTKDDCKKISMIIEDTAIASYESGELQSMLEIVKEFLGDPTEENRLTSAKSLQKALRRHNKNRKKSAPPSQEELVAMEELFPALERQAFSIQIEKVRNYSPAGAGVYATKELEETFATTVQYSALQLTDKTTIVFPPRVDLLQCTSFAGSFLHYHPMRDCLFAGSFYDVKAEVRKYSGYQTFENIASSYLESYFATKNRLARAQMRIEIVTKFNSATNGGWFYHLSNKDKRMYRLSCNDLLKTPTRGGNPYLNNALLYMKNENTRKQAKKKRKRTNSIITT